MSSYRYAFAEFDSDTLVDWLTYDNIGQNFVSYLETGHELMGDVITEKEANTVYCFFKRTEESITVNPATGEPLYDQPSGCLMRAKWHWTDSAASNRWSLPEQVYKLQNVTAPAAPEVFDYGFEVVQSINQVRGKGRALSLRFESQTGKDFHLLGWSVPYTGITGP